MVVNWRAEVRWCWISRRDLLLTLSPSAVKCSWLYKKEEQRVNKCPQQDAAGGGGRREEADVVVMVLSGLLILQRGPPSLCKIWELEPAGGCNLT